MKLVGRILSVIIVIGAVIALCLPADAGAYFYAGKRKKVYCGIVGLARTNAGGTSYLNQPAIDAATTDRVVQMDGSVQCVSLFAKLDAMNNMKPSGWTFENPLAATHNKYNLNYWVVPIKSARDLSRMNVLYFPGSGSIKLTNEERENLRRFVDGGGVLWVDNAGGALPLTFDDDGPFFINQLSFSITGISPTDTDGPVSRHHPLLCSPYWLTDVEIMNLGTNALGGARSYCDMGTGWGGPTQPISFDILYSIVDGVNNSTGQLLNRPAVVANAYGSGRVVATANFVGKGCVSIEPYSLPSLKFAYNILSYASSWTDLRKNPRHSGNSIDTLGSNRLTHKWRLPEPPTENRECGPLLYKNTVFYTSGDTLYALEQNGDTNNGMYKQDEDGEVVIWSWKDPKGSTLSSPTIATIGNPDPDETPKKCKPMEAVMVMDTKGTVYVLEAFPLNEVGRVKGPLPINGIYHFETAEGSPSDDSKWPSPPIYTNGWFYAVGGNGRLYADNPCRAKLATMPGNSLGEGFSSSWMCPNSMEYPNNGSFNAVPKGGPSFGFVKNQNSGAIVGMVYWFISAINNNDPGNSDINDHICGIPVSVSMDRIKQNNGGGQVQVNYPNPNVAGYLTPPDPNDDPNDSHSALIVLQSDGVTPVTTITNVKMNNPSNGHISFQGNIPADAIIYASYSISYNDMTPTSRFDMEIEPKTASSTGSPVSHKATLMTGTPAMGPDNMLYVTAKRDSNDTSNQYDGGSILAYQSDGERSAGGDKLKWHYFLHSGINSGDSSTDYLPGMDVELKGVIQCPDPLDPNHPTQGMRDAQPCSSPAVVGGKVFVTVSGHTVWLPTDAKTTRAALVCLKSNPDFVISIKEDAGIQNGVAVKQPKSLYRKNDHGQYTVKLWQPNLINSSTITVPLMDARQPSGGIRVDYDNGTITFSDFSRTKLQSMSVTTNTFSPSLPVWVWLDNIEVPIDWSTWKPGAHWQNTPPASSDSVDLSGWNNLLWYYIVPDHSKGPCKGAHSPPTVIGSTVYFICDDGYLYALDTETGESGALETSQKPIPQELKKRTSSEGSSLGTNPAVSVAGANGVLLAPGPDGLHAFTDTTTLVADNNRIVELDGEGEVTWAVDSISWPGATPSSQSAAMAIKQGSVNKPSRARYASTGEILFANSGTNQVCKIDKSGMVGFEGTGGQYVRWIYDKFTDPRHLLRPGQPLTLSSPTDAIMWQEMEPPPSNAVMPPTAGVSVVHCVIADSGNSRLLDLVYRVQSGRFVKYDNINPVDDEYIDPDSGFVMPELNWVSKTDSLNERYAFDCIQKVAVWRTDNGVPVVDREDIWAASSNYASTGTNMGGDSPKGRAGLGGAILAIGYRTLITNPGVWNYNTPTSGTITARCDKVSFENKAVPLANPRYFEVLQPETETRVGLSLLICDNYGVYRAEITGNGIPSVMYQIWDDIKGEYVPYLPLLEADYRNALRTNEKDPGAPSDAPVPSDMPVPAPLMPTCVQKLQNGNWLITNNYSGSNTIGATTFGGEVFEFDPRVARVPNPDPTGPPMILPSIAFPYSSPHLQRIWAGGSDGSWTNTCKQVTANTYNLKQPKSALRKQ